MRYYWYGPNKHSEAKVSQWIKRLMREDNKCSGTEIPVSNTARDDYEEAKCTEELVEDINNGSDLEEDSRKRITGATGLDPTQQRNTFVLIY